MIEVKNGSETKSQRQSVIQEGITNYRAEASQLSEGHHELTDGLRHMDSGSRSSIFDSKIVKLVWNVDDVARELECSVRHVRKLVSENKIPYLKIGRLVRFSPLRVREWLHKGGTR